MGTLADDHPDFASAEYRGDPRTLRLSTRQYLSGNGWVQITNQVAWHWGRDSFGGKTL